MRTKVPPLQVQRGGGKSLLKEVRIAFHKLGRPMSGRRNRNHSIEFPFPYLKFDVCGSL